jgi:hypothetical protein
MNEENQTAQAHESLRPVVRRMLEDLIAGAGDKDKRRQVEEWLRNLSDKFPAFDIQGGLREYYLAEAERLIAEFERASDLTEKLGFARSIESFLDKAAEVDRRLTDK